MGKVAILILQSLAWLYFLSPRWIRRVLEKSVSFKIRALQLRGSVIESNLKRAYPDENKAQLRKRIFEAYSHLGRLTWEILLLFGPLRKFVSAESELRGLENWKKAKEKGVGVLFLASHVGNWEVMAATGALHGIELLLVTKLLKPSWFHQAIEKGRLTCGVKGTYEPRTLRDVLPALKRNETVGFVLDQYAGPPVSVRVPVFGVPVGTSLALATLAKRTGAAVLPVKNYRLPSGRFVVEIEPPLSWVEDSNAHQELAINTACYAAKIEEHIRAHPDQWLWSHRRFKGRLDPLDSNEWGQGKARE